MEYNKFKQLVEMNQNLKINIMDCKGNNIGNVLAESMLDYVGLIEKVYIENNELCYKND